jgi:hypothetical protein
MNSASLRLAYIVEFLIAIPAVFTVWSQVGGQGHLDLMPWYWKLLLGTGAAWAIVRVTAAVLEHDRLLTMRSVTWFVCVLLFAAAMAAATYYYHLHENPEEGTPEDSTTASLTVPGKTPEPRWTAGPAP